RATTELVAERIDNELAQRREALVLFSSQLHNGQSLRSLADLRAALNSRVMLRSAFNNGIVITNAQGVIVVDSPVVPGRVGRIVGDREHFVRVMTEKIPVISPPVIGKATPEPLFVISA